MTLIVIGVIFLDYEDSSVEKKWENRMREEHITRMNLYL